MKAFTVVLLCFFAVVQGRSTGEQAPTAAALGENPWVVHIRVAVATSGFLNSCVGSLVANRWVLTTANCVRDVRFLWLRYGAVNVIAPELVTETTAVQVHPNFNPVTGENDIALININRNVEFTDNISAVSLGAIKEDSEVPSPLNFCGFGGSEAPGEILSCSDVAVERSENGNLVASTDATQFDIGAPLVSDGVQYGMLTGADDDGVSQFIDVGLYADWIGSVTGLSGFDVDIVE